jgi:hypothetical protein
VVWRQKLTPQGTPPHWWRGAKSSPTTLATVMQMGRKIGKISVMAGNTDGFVANRSRAPFNAEMVILLEEGCLTPPSPRRAELQLSQAADRRPSALMPRLHVRHLSVQRMHVLSWSP